MYSAGTTSTGKGTVASGPKVPLAGSKLVRGPVPHVVEAFVLTGQAGGAGTRLVYDGEIGADLWLLGQRWCALVARRWDQTVAASLAAVKAEAERRASSVVGRRRSRPDRPPPTTG
jgi:hypothetical protein